jgi:DNA-binding LacI/PurR family transcriptional regulator
MAFPKRITLKDVAARAGVSYQTVSKVLNGLVQVAPETEVRIWEAARYLDYQPSYTARSLRTRRSFTIGYSWTPSPTGLANSIMDQFFQSMVEAAEEQGYYVLSFPHNTEHERQLAGYSALVESGRVDGFILSDVESDDPRVTFLLENDIPFAAFGLSTSSQVFPCIDVDGGLGLRLATEHLLVQGQRKIAALTWPASSRLAEQRLSGYRSAMQSAGVPLDPDWIIESENTVLAGQRAAMTLLNRPTVQRPSAIVAVSDLLAIGAMQAARKLNIPIGKDLAITGFDDIPMAQYLTPPLTSIRQPVWEAGRKAISRLVATLGGDQSAKSYELLPPSLVIRASSMGF